ncbi:Unknown protein, partial [Striga hermonthica]
PELDFHGESSILTNANIVLLRKDVRVPPSIRLFAPYPGERITCPPSGCVGVFAKSLRSGLRFPLPRIITEYLRDWGLALCQIAPNTWKRVIGLLVLFAEKGWDLSSANEMMSMFTFRKGADRQVMDPLFCFFISRKPQPRVKLGNAEEYRKKNPNFDLKNKIGKNRDLRSTEMAGRKNLLKAWNKNPHSSRAATVGPSNVKNEPTSEQEPIREPVLESPAGVGEQPVIPPMSAIVAVNEPVIETEASGVGPEEVEEEL